MVGDSCNPEWLSEQLVVTGSGMAPVLDDKVSVVDCRTVSEYTLQHVIGAMNLTIPTLMMRRLMRGNLPMTSVISCLQQSRPEDAQRTIDWKQQVIVLYDDRPGSDVTASLCNVLLNRFKEDGYQVSLLNGGFEKFQAKYPHLCTNSDREVESALHGVGNLKISSCHHQESNGCALRADTEHQSEGMSTLFPVEVVQYLYLGDAQNAADLPYLNSKGIKYIINVTHNIPNKFATDGHFKYLTIPISDNWSQNLAEYFHAAIQFIDEAMKEKCGVLVHCLAGISRSVTITIAYLMATNSMSLNDAYDYVKRCKPNVSPNLNFMGQLLDFEKELHLESKIIISQDCDVDSGDSVNVSGSSEVEVLSGVLTSPGPSSVSSLSSTALTSSCTSTSSTFNYENVGKDEQQHES